ncbi:MAG: CHAT domain protein [Betaproteobacteria bacterium ADurb.Bin341]|nr:MAG: CHAT domain protein [Betaproteobacteria bacterium ADurb.Bin341]
MAKVSRFLLTVCFVLLTMEAYASDLMLSGLLQQGKHQELIEVLQPRVDGGQGVSSFQLMMLGGAYYEIRKYREALIVCDLMAKRVQEGDRRVFGADLSVYPEIIRAAVSLDQGLYEAAIEHAGRAEAQLEKDQFFYRQQLIQINNVLGIANAYLGRTGQARKNLEKIRDVELSLSNLGPEKFSSMARIHMALGEYDLALKAINDEGAGVDAILTLFYDPTFQNLPKHFIRAKSLFETGQISEAKQGYDELLKHPQIAQFGAVHWVVLYDRARIAQKEGDIALAIELLRKAVDIIELQRSSIDSEAGRIGYVGDKQSVYQQLVSLLISLNRTEEAFDFVERSKSRALVDMLAAKMDFGIPEGNAEKARAALAELERIDNSLRVREASSGAVQVAALRNLQEVRQKIHDAAPELAALVAVSAVPATELKGLLRPDEVLLEYYLQGDDFFAFVLGGGELKAVRLEGKGLDAEVQALRQALEQPRGDAWKSIAGGLHARLWQPIQGVLGATKKVVVVPHGALHYLPFAVLSDTRGNFLIDRYDLRFLPSASVLKFLSPVQASVPSRILVLGNPDLGDPGLDLQFAEKETRTISALFPGAQMLLRQNASETNFKKAAAAYRRVHFATHGKFRPETPLSSGLYLAKDPENDGVLTVGELYSMRLDAELVTLSACETGLGKVANGNDIVGLARGFLYAGSRAIVASLWSVDDQATAQLMQSFYRNLARMNKPEALRQAQLSTRRAYPHPFYWAAFQITGRGD